MSTAESIYTGPERRVAQRLDFFPEAGDYLRMFARRGPGKIVVKLSGKKVFDERIASGLVAMQEHDVPIVVVHGGGDQIDNNLKKHGKTRPAKIDGVRPTPQDNIPFIREALDEVNDLSCELLSKLGGQAVGIKRGVNSGVPKSPDNVVLEKVDVDPRPILTAVNAGKIPMVSCFGATSWDADKGANGNADAVATAVAVALSADELIFVTDEKGILLKQDDPDSVISKFSPRVAWYLMEDGYISGGAREKVRRGIEALNDGVEYVAFGNDPIKELVTRQGAMSQLSNR